MQPIYAATSKNKKRDKYSDEAGGYASVISREKQKRKKNEFPLMNQFLDVDHMTRANCRKFFAANLAFHLLRKIHNESGSLITMVFSVNQSHN